ncbi:signal peptidase II [Planctomycetota bacterium]
MVVSKRIQLSVIVVLAAASIDICMKEAFFMTRTHREPAVLVVNALSVGVFIQEDSFDFPTHPQWCAAICALASILLVIASTWRHLETHWVRIAVASGAGGFLGYVWDYIRFGVPIDTICLGDPRVSPIIPPGDSLWARTSVYVPKAFSLADLLIATCGVVIAYWFFWLRHRITRDAES